jgi:uncharacterized delta-60 repeat protein
MENRLSLPAYAGVILAVSLTLTPTVGRADAGNLDPAFGIGGKVVTDFAAGIDVANGVAVQADGRIVVVGRAVTSLGSDAALARCNPDGSLDTSFGNSGLVTTHFPTSLSSFGDAEWFDVGIDADGRIVVAGLVLTSSSVTLRDFAVARYDTNGSLDTTFGGAGFVTTPSPFNADGVGGLALQADGKIVVAGLLFVAATGGRDFALMRYSTNGTLDTSFGTGGIVTTSFPSSSDDGAVDLAIQTDGNIVAVGNAAFVSTLGDFAIVRYNPDGSLDTTFGNDGRVITDFGSSADFARSVVIQSDGRILVAGQTYRSGYAFALARYESDGSLDGSFSTNGRVITRFASGGAMGYDVALQADGAIVVAGRLNVGPNVDDFALARYHPDGRLDGGFGEGGLVTTDFASRSDYASAVALQADGKIVAAGISALGGRNPDFAVARYEGVSTPRDRIEDLIALVSSFDLSNGIETSLIVKLRDALVVLDAGETATACEDLGAFVNEVQAQAGRKLTTDQADLLLAAADEVGELLGCP